jgi:hypothetical protein
MTDYGMRFAVAVVCPSSDRLRTSVGVPAWNVALGQLIERYASTIRSARLVENVIESPIAAASVDDFDDQSRPSSSKVIDVVGP